MENNIYAITAGVLSFFILEFAIIYIITGGDTKNIDTYALVNSFLGKTSASILGGIIIGIIVKTILS